MDFYIEVSPREAGGHIGMHPYIVFFPALKYPDIPALLVELKHDKNADMALSQIRRQDYPARLEHYKGNILLVGIDYDKDIPKTRADFKHYSCRIEEA